MRSSPRFHPQSNLGSESGGNVESFESSLEFDVDRDPHGHSMNQFCPPSVQISNRSSRSLPCSHATLLMMSAPVAPFALVVSEFCGHIVYVSQQMGRLTALGVPFVG